MMMIFDDYYTLKGKNLLLNLKGKNLIKLMFQYEKVRSVHLYNSLPSSSKFGLYSRYSIFNIPFEICLDFWIHENIHVGV